MPFPGPDRDAPDERLLQRAFADGDMRAFQAVISRYSDDLYTLVLRMMGSVADADEVAQDALLRAWERRHLYESGQPLRPWLLTIAANLARSRLRSAWWKRWRPLEDWQGIVDSPELATIAADRDRKVRRALMALAPHYREALALYYLQDMAYAEMSQITGVKVPALKQRVRRGMQHLERVLQSMYPELVPPRTSHEDD